MARYGRDYRPRGRGYDRPYYGYGRGGYYGASMYGGGRYGEDFYLGAWSRGGWSARQAREVYGPGYARRAYDRDLSPGPNRYRGARPFSGGALQG